jgi:hypothetical protein
MTSHNSSPLVLHVLETTSLDRLYKATEALAHNAYTISFTTRSDTEIGAYVKNGDGIEYAVTLTATRAFCSCKDSMFRHMICKHTVAVALQALRTPVEDNQGAINILTSQQPISHLMRPNARAVLCGEQYPERILYWPWPESIVNNQTQWPEISVCPDCIRNRYPVGHETANGAPNLSLSKVRPEHGARSAV